jgi:hypothetical protein
VPKESRPEHLREALAHAVSSPQLAGEAELTALLTELTEASLSARPPALPPDSTRQIQRLRKRLYEYRESFPSRRFHIYIPRESLAPELRVPGVSREQAAPSLKNWLWAVICAAALALAVAALLWWRLSVQSESAIFRFGAGQEIQSFSIARNESWIVYAAQPDPAKPPAIFRLAPDTSDTFPLSEPERRAALPALSPDGSRFSYWREDAPAKYSLVWRPLEDPPEQNQTLLEATAPSAQCWDATGTHVLTSRNGALVSIDVATRAAVELLPREAQFEDTDPLPRPQSSDLLFLRRSSRGAASLSLLAGGQVAVLAEGLYQVRGFAWAPDGQHVYLAAEHQAQTGIWRLTIANRFLERARLGGPHSHSPVIAQRIFWLDESVERRLARLDLDSKRWTDQPLSQVPLAAPVFSGDGAQWAMRVQEAGRSSFLLHPRNYSLSLSDLEVRGSAVWTADARTLVFPARRTGRAAIYTQALEGGLPKLLAQCPAEASSPRFDAAGRWLAFLCGAELYKLAWPPDGGEPKRISLESWRSLEFDSATQTLLACGFDLRRSRVDLDRDTFERLPAPIEFLDPAYTAAGRREYFFASPAGFLRHGAVWHAAFSPLAEAPPPASDTDRALSVSPDGKTIFLHSRKVENLGLNGMRLPSQ